MNNGSGCVGIAFLLGGVGLLAWVIDPPLNTVILALALPVVLWLAWRSMMDEP